MILIADVEQGARQACKETGMADRRAQFKQAGARAEKAQRRAEQMAARFGKEIERSLAGVAAS
ncbi:MAG: hypothetical protein ACLTSX_06785 [Collinsella sp.]